MLHRSAPKDSASVMRRLVVVLALGALCSGCAVAGWFRDTVGTRSGAAQLVARADEMVRDGQPGAAREIYARVVAEAPRDAVHARALHRLARLHVDPSSEIRDYGAARLSFERLLTEYPTSEWESDARAWHAALAELETRETELAAREAELAARDALLAARRAELAARDAELAARQAELMAREAETARLKSEVAKLGADLQRLKRIDLNLERRR
jgi:hypothetical protein